MKGLDGEEQQGDGLKHQGDGRVGEEGHLKRSRGHGVLLLLFNQRFAPISLFHLQIRACFLGPKAKQLDRKRISIPRRKELVVRKALEAERTPLNQ